MRTRQLESFDKDYVVTWGADSRTRSTKRKLRTIMKTNDSFRWLEWHQYSAGRRRLFCT